MDRRPELDGLRGVAVLMTVLLHYIVLGGYFPYLGPAPVANLLRSFWSGVDIFFVLSGFLIGGIVLDHGRAGNFYRVFYLRRGLRILPVALLAIAFSYGVLPLVTNPLFARSGDVPPYAYLLFINNLWTATGADKYPPLGPMWSLAIEEQFYLFAPALLLLASARVRVIGLLAIFLASPVLRSLNLGVSGWDFTLLRLDGLAAGILLAVLVRDEKCCELVRRHIRYSHVICGAAVAAALLFGMFPPRSGSLRIAWGAWLNTIAASSVILHLHFNRGSSLSVTLSRAWLVVLGRLSYFIYLMHMPLLAFVIAMMGPFGTPVVLWPAAMLTLVTAWVSWRYMESRLIALGKRVPYGTRGWSERLASPSREAVG